MLYNKRFEEDGMPPKREVTRQRVLEVALCIVEEQGIEAVTARSVALRLHCSTQPIYSLFENMEELVSAAYDLALGKAIAIITGYQDDRYIPELRLAIGYYFLARQHRVLFRSVYQSDYSHRHCRTHFVGEEMLTLHLPRSQRMQRLDAEGLRRAIKMVSIFINGLGAMLNAGTLDIPLEEAACLTTEMYDMAVNAALTK
jgi:AcrR family transcriptional regulator